MTDDEIINRWLNGVPVRTILQESGITQSRLSRIVGVSRQSISQGINRIDERPGFVHSRSIQRLQHRVLKQILTSKQTK